MVTPGDARPPLVLVIDAGSSSLRCAVYDGRARRVDGWEARDAHPLHTTPDGGVEEDAVEVTERVTGLIDRVLAALGDRAGEIAAAGMASFASTLVGVDADGAPLTPVYAYADTRPAAEVRALRAALDEDAVHQRTGCRLHTSYLPARLRWLQRTQPEIWRRRPRWMSLPEFVYLRFLGTARTSYSVASWSGLLNRATLEWDAEWRDLLEIEPAQLSPIDDAPLRGLAPAYARRWPALAGVAWFPGHTDGAASNIGSGCTTPADAALSIGTSGALRVVTETPPEVVPPGLWCYRVDRRRALVGGALNDAGSIAAWARETLHLDDFEQAEAQVGQAEPDGHGLTVLPFLTGERSTGWNPAIRAAIAGIERATTPVAILQALMESVAYRFGAIGGQLFHAAPEAQRLVASGGGAAHSPVWVQMIADVLDRPVALCADEEATSRGVAVLALSGLTGSEDHLPPPRIERTFEPDPARRQVYAAAMTRQRDLYRRLADWCVQ